MGLMGPHGGMASDVQRPDVAQSQYVPVTPQRNGASTRKRASRGTDWGALLQRKRIPVGELKLVKTLIKMHAS